MYKKLLKTLACIWLLYSCLPTASAQYFSHQLNLQDSTQVHILRTKRGDRFVGQLKDIRSTNLFFQLGNGDELTFAFNEVISIITWREENLDGNNNWQRQFRGDLLGNRESRSIGAENLIYSSTAFNYEEGDGEVRSFAFIVNVVDVGVAKGLSVGGGLALPDIGILRLKGTTPLNQSLHLGAGVNMIFPLTDLTGIEGVAHTYAILTAGNPDRFFNFTLGAFVALDSFNDDIFVGSIGGGYRVSREWRLHFEMIFGADEGAFIPAVGAVWQKGNFKMDLGLAGLPDTDIESTLIPILALGFVF
ncbi:MAG: hypothetical protein HRU41_16895 [Saprospiraceae bacterium]|nr:hypothetical protein [Saprospiraceae bacterium]